VGRKGNYSVKRVGGGYVREPSSEDLKWEEEKMKSSSVSIVDYSKEQRRIQFDQSKNRASACEDFTPLAVFKLFDRTNIGYLTPNDIMFSLDRLGVRSTFNDID
jgi:hypothetical protein